MGTNDCYQFRKENIFFICSCKNHALQELPYLSIRLLRYGEKCQHLALFLSSPPFLVGGTSEIFSYPLKKLFTFDRI